VTHQLARPLVSSALILLATIVSSTTHAQTFKPPLVMNGAEYPTPYCTNRGRRVELGKLACLQGVPASFLARCIMVSNNSSWQKIQPGCPANIEHQSKSK
jgi:hypothetical protein